MGACGSNQAAAVTTKVKPVENAPTEAGGVLSNVALEGQAADVPAKGSRVRERNNPPFGLEASNRRDSAPTSGTQTDDDEDNDASPFAAPALPPITAMEEDGEFDITADDDGGSSSLVSNPPLGNSLPGIQENETFSASPGAQSGRTAPGSTDTRSQVRLMKVCSSGTPSTQLRAISETMHGRRHPLAVQMMSPQSSTDAMGRRPVSPRPAETSPGDRERSVSELLHPSTEDAATIGDAGDRRMSVADAGADEEACADGGEAAGKL